MFEIAKMENIKTELIHISFGIMTKDGKKFSTRDGNVIALSKVLDEGIDKARKIVELKRPDLMD